MQSEYKSFKNLKWIVHDMTVIDEKYESSFEVIIEKGVIDAVVAGSKSPWPENMDEDCKDMVAKSCRNVKHMLVEDGMFISISFASPMLRSELLDERKFGW